MERGVANWERLVRAVLAKNSRKSKTAIAGAVPSSLGDGCAQIEEILSVADRIQDEDPYVARILWLHSFSLAQKLDPNSEGRGMIQFKTGLMTIIKTDNSQTESRSIEPKYTVPYLIEFYKKYGEKYQIDELPENETTLRESRVFSASLQQLELITVKQKEALATLNTLSTVIKSLAREISQDYFSDEMKKLMERDAAMADGGVAYNIIPLDDLSDGNYIASFPEVRAAVSALQYHRDLPRLPNNFPVPESRTADILDFLHYVFGFQKDNVRNQREHVIHLIANEQSRFGKLPVTDPKIEEGAVRKVFNKSLGNYKSWCQFLPVQPFWNDVESLSKEKMLLYICLYFLIWGEAANVRFLPECLCYIFHQMAKEMEEMMREGIARPAASCETETKNSFLDKVITPLYEVVAAEAKNSNHGRASHAAWRNYDDFNEFFWSQHCFELGWPIRPTHPFFLKPTEKKKFGIKRNKHYGKTFFVEHRSFLHLYHSFHRLWIFLVVMFQGLTIIAFNDGNLKDGDVIKKVLSVVPTFLIMKFIKSVLDIWIKYGAISTSGRSAITRIVYRVLWFAFASIILTLIYVKSFQRGNSALYTMYLIVVIVYILIQIFFGVVMRFPFCSTLTLQCRHWSIPRLIMKLKQEDIYVGRGMDERFRDYIIYAGFWVVLLASKFSFTYFLQIQPLVKPTRTIVNFTDLKYDWHDIVSKHNHNAMTVLSLWAPVVSIYLLDIYVFYTVLSAIWGFLLGAKHRLGEIRTVEQVHRRFASYPGAFMNNLHVDIRKREQLRSTEETTTELDKFDASRFAPFWNEIIKNLREEDYISNREMGLLLMPKNYSPLPLVQWPLFLLASKVLVAKKIAKDSKKIKDNQEELWSKISRDKYMKFAIQECFYSVRHILTSVLDKEGKLWVKILCDETTDTVNSNTVMNNIHFSKLEDTIDKVKEIMKILKEKESSELRDKLKTALHVFYQSLQDLLIFNKGRRSDEWNTINQARANGTLFSNFTWPNDSELIELIKRLHLLLDNKESAADVPKNLEARRRLEFFTTSLFMQMPTTKPVSEMMPFSVFTPYYKEIVLYSAEEIQHENEDGITTLFYLQKIFPDEWDNFLERIGRKKDTKDKELFDKNNDSTLEVRFWASYRGQTLARTVRGMMYYRKAIMLQSYIERNLSEDIESGFGRVDSIETKGFELSREGRALADLKFTYVVSCQIYGEQKAKKEKEATDIALLLQRNKGLRIAFMHVVEVKGRKEYYSKLIKDVHGKDKEIYSVKLPGNPILGEGKPENQNHAIIFTRGNAVQTIDMNQDNYFEEALKMRNLLEEFDVDHGAHKVTILGVREHVFTGSVSSLASFMSNQETSFVTLGQRVLSTPLKVRMHYGHPDVFDRVFHITRGGISKSSKTINVSEDIYAGFNSTLRKGNITHHEYIQVGKGRDVGLNQIAAFEGKVAGGNGEQVLSRDVYRLGQLFDFFRMMSFYITTVGFYFCTMLTVLTVYIFLYGKAYLALSGVGEDIQTRANILDNASLTSALNTQFLVQIGIFSAIPMILGFILEQGLLSAIVSFTTMQLQLCSVFFTFSLGTRTHYFGRTILHGGAGYKATGRGFVVSHVKFAENYRLYSRSHFTKGLEVVLLLVVFLSYGFNNGGAIGYILLSISSWFMALSWLFAPYLFNPSGFEWQKIVEDFTDWTDWLFYRGGIGVKIDQSWETWWEGELAHIQSFSGRLLETVLCLRFFIFQYGIVYQLQASNSSKSLAVYGFSWAVLAGLLVLFVVFGFDHNVTVNFQLIVRLIKTIVTLVVILGLSIAVAFTSLSIGDIFSCILAFVPTIWGILSIAVTWKPVVKKLRLWKAVRSVARVFDAGIGMLIFIPIAFCAWFPFLSTFQTRLLFNQAFSRGLEISLVLYGGLKDEENSIKL
ncbi:hypothetical protein LUZ60_014572 [Juncus effusus]|nr:hypothetical protein LUZ60_014572 [Juncus effusus]